MPWFYRFKIEERLKKVVTIYGILIISQFQCMFWEPKMILEYSKTMIYKVNRCLARYSPRATTTNQPTNRAPNELAMDKNANFGLKELVPFTQLVKVRGGNLVWELPSIQIFMKLLPDHLWH